MKVVLAEMLLRKPNGRTYDQSMGRNEDSTVFAMTSRDSMTIQTASREKSAQSKMVVAVRVGFTAGGPCADLFLVRDAVHSALNLNSILPILKYVHQE